MGQQAQNQTVLVTGASGYVGGRLIPLLLQEGHSVRAAILEDEDVSDFSWSDAVEQVVMDALDSEQVAAAVAGVDAVYYLIHGMAGADFVDKDRRSAQTMATASQAAGVRRLVYLSGIVPDVDEEELSDHISSRREVEQILTDSGIHTVTLRAAVLLGAASTSYEITRQIAQRLPVQTIPTWMDSRVQPIAVVDALQALLGALTVEGPSRAYDIGGPQVLTYAELLDRVGASIGVERSQVSVPLVPTAVVAKVAGLVTDVPSPTVEALIESLQHDMVCHEEGFQRDLLPSGHQLMSLDEALVAAAAPPADGSTDPMTRLPTDPPWASDEPPNTP